MKRALLLSLLAAGVLSGCSSVYKSGQTPDDVYYSPGRDAGTFTRKEEVKQRLQQVQYDEYVSSQDDRYLRRKVANRNRWNTLDDFNYWYDSRYDFGAYTTYNNYNNWYPSWNYALGYGGWRPGLGLGYSYGCGCLCGPASPIYTLIGYATPKFYVGSTSGSNITAYKNRAYNNTNLGYTDPKTGTRISTGSSNSFSNLVKKVFSTAVNDNSSNSYDRPARTFSSSNTSTNSTNATTTNNTSSSAGGNSGGFKSTGSSSSSGRGGRGN
ncbi:MAG: hypothetical protein NVSMB63_02380 [Sediminibacterium sp.]